jgi:hypothetical protein
MWAADKGKLSCVRLLLDAGANKDLKDNVRLGRCVAVMCHLQHLSHRHSFVFRVFDARHVISMLSFRMFPRFSCSGRPDRVGLGQEKWSPGSCSVYRGSSIFWGLSYLQTHVITVCFVAYMK